MATLFNIAKRAFARERKTVSTSVVTLTTATFYPAGNPANAARGALISVISGNLFFTIDGTAPTNDATVAGVGTPLNANDKFVLENFEQLQKFQAIRNSLTDAIVEVVYFR